MISQRAQTTPHDYRLVCESVPAPTVVGGQAVNLWAINYLAGSGSRDALVSKDLDIVATPDSIRVLRHLPGWVFQPRQTRNWMDSRLGALRSATPDGRPLLVEILHSVHGLTKADLNAAAFIKADGVVYRVLDPVAMLKAKAANVRDIDQVGPPPRQDRLHLRILARCLPEFLRDVHQSAIADPAREKEALAVFSRAFRTLQHDRTAHTLAVESIDGASLMPPEFSESPLARIRAAYAWQMPRLARRPTGPSVASGPAIASSPERPGPRMGI